MRLVFALTLLLPCLLAQETHHHPAPERLGTVSFPISCNASSQADFNRGVALLHSFAYAAAEQTFRNIARQDPGCAMAHWGVAMTHFHQLWEPPLPRNGDTAASAEIALAARLPETSPREGQYIHALSLLFQDQDTVPYRERALHYEQAMQQLARQHQDDTEAQIFYALALISNASPLDQQHSRQKQAAAILEPLDRQFPDHPGIPHYLIHAYDSQELAPRGLKAARVYAAIAPSAPHALHMPSHIFTRLGLWDDSIHSNLAARQAAIQQGDQGEQLHAMDYLVYAYLQTGRDAEAGAVVQQLHDLGPLNEHDFKIAYAATAMPIRILVERQRWSEAEALALPDASVQPYSQAIALWAHGLGAAHNGHAGVAQQDAAALSRIEEQLRAAGDSYWSAQADILRREILAWVEQSSSNHQQALTLLRRAADDEDATEKLPVTPGPILPAREQLGWMLLQQGDRAAAHTAFVAALVNAPGRRGAVQGAAQSAPRGAQAATAIAPVH